MGALISFFRDAKALLRDLRETVKVTMKLIVSVNKIVGDVEEIVEELKISVRLISKNIEAKTVEHENVMKSVKESLETVESVKKCLVDNVRNVVSEALVKDVTEKIINEREKKKDKPLKELEDGKTLLGCGSTEVQESDVPNNHDKALVPSDTADTKSIAVEAMEAILEAIGKSSVQNALLSWEPGLMLTSILSYQDNWLAPLSSRYSTPTQSLKARGLEFLVERSLLSKIHSIEGPLVAKLSMWYLGNKCKRFLMSDEARGYITEALEHGGNAAVVSQHGRKVVEVLQLQREAVIHSQTKQELVAQQSKTEDRMTVVENNISEDKNLTCVESQSQSKDERQTLPENKFHITEEQEIIRTESQELGALNKRVSQNVALPKQTFTSDEDGAPLEHSSTVNSPKVCSAELLEVGRQYILGSSEHLGQLQSKLRDHRTTCAELQSHLNSCVGVLNSVL